MYITYVILFVYDNVVYVPSQLQGAAKNGHSGNIRVGPNVV